VSAGPRWRYVQARLQARHGDRLTEGDWRALEAARSLDHFLDRARAMALSRFTAPLNAAMTSHKIERLVRAAWRGYVAEVAAWLDHDWQAAVQWAALVPDLPAVDALLKGDVPAWLKEDTLLAAFAEGEAAQRLVRLENSPFAPLVPAPSREPSLPKRWAAHWRSLWPRLGKADAGALQELAALVAAHNAQLALAMPPATSPPYRNELMIGLTRLLRRHGATPVAVFSHLALTALDLERLRGGLVRRALFAPARAREAA
jgi:hypothetical protein